MSPFLRHRLHYDAVSSQVYKEKMAKNSPSPHEKGSLYCRVLLHRNLNL